MANSSSKDTFNQVSVNCRPEEEKKTKSFKQRCSALYRPCVIGLIFGSLLSGTVLAVILTMYIQDSRKSSTTVTTVTSTTSTTSTTTTSTTTTTTTTTSTTTSVTTSTTTTTTPALPSQCFSYSSNSDATRNVGYSSSSSCDSGIFGSGTWVRFFSPAGTFIPNYYVIENNCGTSATGWYTGTYPSTAGASVSGSVCYSWSGSSCSWSNLITITNCDTFYVFFLTDPPTCNLRYCTV